MGASHGNDIVNLHSAMRQSHKEKSRSQSDEIAAPRPAQAGRSAAPFLCCARRFLVASLVVINKDHGGSPVGQATRRVASRKLRSRDVSALDGNETFE